jgi:hypothetical protein
MPKRTPRPAASVREPVQVYLAPDDRDLLNRLAEETGLTKAEILRRGLRGFAREQSGSSPMLAFVSESAKGEWPEDVAGKHDEILAETYRATTRKRR